MINHSTLLKSIGVLCLSLLLVACSYHLRGDAEMPEVMRHLNLRGASPLLSSSFKDTMRLAGGTVTDKPEGNGVIINVVNERFDRRTSSLSSTGKTNEFQLLYVLDYEVLAPDGKLVLPSQNIEVNRNYYNDQQAIVGKENEEVLIRQEMYRQAVRSILDRGRALVSHAPKK